MLLQIGIGVTVISSVVVFLAVLLFLVGILLYARKKLTPQGKVKLILNGEKELEVNPGSTLLTTLAVNDIFLPSACGGGGTCAMCKCQVTSGGGSILPTEVGYFTRREQQDHWRLGCQVKVREDMQVDIPPEVFGIRKWECEVVSNHNVATYIKEFVVKLPEGERLEFRSGGYIQIDVPKCEVNYRDIDVEPEYRGDWDKYKMWDLKMKNPEPVFRAYSMANYPAEENIIKLNIRIATPPWDAKACAVLKVNPGICSSYIFSRKPGDKIVISGPYGEFFIKDTNREMMFIGGGAGMAPMRSHIFDLFKNKEGIQSVTSHVRFKALTDTEIEKYVATGECLDKAGAYAIQGRAAFMVESIAGSYTNVVGLPLTEVVDDLPAAGVIAVARD